MVAVIILVISPWQIFLPILIILIFLLIRAVLYGKSMRYEISETITSNSSKEDILKVLLDKFKKVADAVIRKEDMLTVNKVEAFFGFFRSDTSIIRLKENNNGFLLSAEVNYKPSGWFWLFFIVGLLFYLVGCIVPLIFFFYQKSTVREAIQNVFSSVKNEFKSTNSTKVASNTTDLDQLEKLYVLKEKGIITEDEFNAKKQEILKK